MFSEGGLYVSKIDVTKAIVPLLKPAECASQLPAPPRVIVLDAGLEEILTAMEKCSINLHARSLLLESALASGRSSRVSIRRSRRAMHFWSGSAYRSMSSN